MTLNMNNELNAICHRTSVIRMFAEFKVVGRDIDFLLHETSQWGAREERLHSELKDKRHSLVIRLKRAGMFL